MTTIRNDSGARRNLAFGPYRLVLAPGQTVHCDLGEYVEWLRDQPGITVTDEPVGQTEPEPASDKPTRRSTNAKIIVH